MYPISDAFRQALYGNHTVIQKVEVWQSGSYFRNIFPTTANVSVSDDAIRRKFTFRLDYYDSATTPFDVYDLLDIYLAELRPYRGILFPDGTEEYIPLGRFRIEDRRIDDNGDQLAITCLCFDYSRAIATRRFIVPYTVASGTNYATAIKDLINNRMPGLTYNFMVTSETTPKLTFQQASDPWEAALFMAKALGADLFFDPNGVCTLRPFRDIATSGIDFTYEEGEQANFMHVDIKQSKSKTYNHVVVMGESSDSVPVRGEATDDNPNSPTYINGAFGDVPYFLSSPYVKTVAQAEAWAARELHKRLGKSEQVNFIAFVNPAHDVEDVLYMRRERADLNARHLLTDFNIHLHAAQPMNATTKERYVA